MTGVRNGVALITGGQRGIGLGIARALKQQGFKLALVARQSEDGAEVQAALQELGEGTRYYSHDVSNAGAHDGLLDRIEADLGTVSCLVSNAGVGAPVRGDMLDITPENFDFVQGINLRGAFFLAQAVAKRLVGQSADTYRSIIFVGSVSATMVSIERAEYCVSKAALSMASEAFAVRLAPEGIGVFEVRPGIIQTPMTAGVQDKYTARIADGLVPAKRWGQPEDIANVIVPLARGDMAFASGTVINADGGLAIPRL